MKRSPILLAAAALTLALGACGDEQAIENEGVVEERGTLEEAVVPDSLEPTAAEPPGVNPQ